MALEGATFDDLQERTCINVIFQDKERLSYTAMRTSKLGKLMRDTQSSKLVLFAAIYKSIFNDFVNDADSGTEIIILIHLAKS
jgi:hypothetical protein